MNPLVCQYIGFKCPTKVSLEEHIFSIPWEDRRRHPVGSFGPTHPGVPFADIPENHRERPRAWKPLAMYRELMPRGHNGVHYQTRENKNFTFPSFLTEATFQQVTAAIPTLYYQRKLCGVYKNDSSSSNALQPHFILISSRISAYEVQWVRGQPFSELGFLISPRVDVWQSFVTMCMKMILLKGESCLI